MPDIGLFNKKLLTNSFVKKTKEQKWTQWAVKEGFTFLNESLAKHLTSENNVNIIRNAEIQRVKPQVNGQLTVEYASAGR